jgi:hypothetical protein
VSRVRRDPQVEAVVVAYRGALEAGGQFAENEVTSPARSFLLCVGVDGWAGLSLEQQLVETNSGGRPKGRGCGWLGRGRSSRACAGDPRGR